MFIRKTVLALIVVMFSGVMATAESPVVFHVATGGDDRNPGTEAKPFATVAKARDAVRAVNRDMSCDVAVVLHGGVYPVSETIVLDADDSGRNGHEVVYRAADGETPVISGGKRVVDWQKDEKGRWKASAPVDNFRQLYVDGVRATRARGDLPAEFELDGDDGYTTSAVEMADWKHPEDIEICYVVVWCHTRCKVESIERQGDRAKITMLQPHFSNAKVKEGVNITGADATYLENALELLDEPGEWYLDRKAKAVYYMPREGEDMTKVEVVVPSVEKLVELRGTLDRPVHDIHFEGITFADAGWLLPSEIGFVDLQANFTLDWKNPFHRKTGLTAVHNEALKSPANVVCHAAKFVRFDRCTFTRFGGAGLDLEYGSQGNTVVGCEFRDISGTAIQIGDVLKDDHHPDDPRKIVQGNTVSNCHIHACGQDYWGSIGIFAGYTEGTTIAHNEIADLPYTGISLGWGWGEEDEGGGRPEYTQPFWYDTPTAAKNNRIACNNLHHIMRRMNGASGIFTLGVQPGTVIFGNYIHDCSESAENVQDRPVHAGISLGEGSGSIEIMWNLVLDVQNPASYTEYSQDRISTCTEHDNFLGENPPEARAISDNAGLEKPYRDLLPTSE